MHVGIMSGSAAFPISRGCNKVISDLDSCFLTSCCVVLIRDYIAPKFTTTMTIPPGLAYLARVLPLILIPPCVVYGILNIISRDYLEIGIPEWLALVVSVFSLPIVLCVSALHTNYRNRREAAARGAVLAPLVKDRWPGGLSTLATILRNFKSGYPGWFHCSVHFTGPYIYQ
jgi:hypothetical protein